MMLQEIARKDLCKEMTVPGPSSAPITGLPVIGRDERAMGYVFDLASPIFCDCIVPPVRVDPDSPVCERCTLVKLARIGSSVHLAGGPGGITFDCTENCADALVIFKIEVGQLSKVDVLRQLAYLSGLLLPLNLTVSIAFSEGSWSDGDSLMRFRACLYALEDAGIRVLLSGSLILDYGTHPFGVLGKNISGFLVSPGLLGLGEFNGTYDPATFEAGTEMLGKIIHEHRKMVVVEDVSTAWQLDVMRTMPFHAFSGSVNRSLVVV